jgi:4-hydroxy-tetrahydrodipicolinate reductase
VHAVVAPGSAADGMPLPAPWDGTQVYAHDWQAAPKVDVMIDFSGGAGLEAALSHCLAQRIALVTGTTGLDSVTEARLVQASSTIPLLRAANFSLGIVVLTRMLREAAAALDNWDLEIIEAHHGRKLDAPSGTALALGSAAAAARGQTLETSAIYGHASSDAARSPGSIGFAVVRGGDLVGEHTAMLIGQGERIELAHRARGALQAAHWLAGRAAGLYRLDDVIAPAMR